MTQIRHSCPDLGAEEIKAVSDCIRSLQLKGSERVRLLERKLAEEHGYRDAIATVSGGHALHILLRAMVRKQPAHVILPSYICRSVYDAVCLAGCRPVLVDIDPKTLSTSPKDALAVSGDVVVVPHMFGIRAELDQFISGGLTVIEDCAHRLAPPQIMKQEQKAPFRFLSLEATKLITCGEGGVLLADDIDVLEKARMLRDAPYNLPEPALGLRLTDVQAALALVQLDRLPVLQARRRSLAEFYLQDLNQRFPEMVVPAMRFADTFHFRFLLQLENPSTFIERGKAQGVNFRLPVAPMALHTLFREQGEFPLTDRASQHLVSIPLYPKLSGEQAETVLRVTTDLLSQEVAHSWLTKEPPQ